MDDDIDIERIARDEVARFEYAGTNFVALGSSREDAVQEVAMRLLRRLDKHDADRSSLRTFLGNEARFGMLDYLQGLEADREKSRPSRRLSRDIDGEVILDLNGNPTYAEDFSEVEREPNHECSQSEGLPGSGLERLEDIAAIGVLLDSVMLGCLTKDERVVIEYSFGLNGKVRSGQREIARKIGKTQKTVSVYYNSAMKKLRAEFQADRIMEL